MVVINSESLRGPLRRSFPKQKKIAVERKISNFGIAWSLKSPTTAAASVTSVVIRIFLAEVKKTLCPCGICDRSVGGSEVLSDSQLRHL